ncbi:MAG: phosphomannomutase [Pseudomonadales bacterium]|nr:phosphomannomutase [Pseudomonadales bacterium]MCP5333562.1 phosphomannomutase [Pseudomonadales bacterium]HMU90184.1 phosphomannomutase [Pseudomonadales bacterium]HMW15223.1 phosphomannomutase [Pseudomonadales bacterium]HMZ91161.1 phosphomannomutase [Pseudomonadales bacterium]
MTQDYRCFKAYDIRGRIPDQLNDEIAWRIGRAFAAYLQPRKVVVGHDIRLSSPQMAAEVMRGLRESGVDVYDIGQCGTEEVYFATFDYQFDGGIMVTASHNPKDYNGMKLVRDNARPISGDTGLFEIKRLAERGEFVDAEVQGSHYTLQHRARYITHLLGYIDASALKPLKLVVNAGNGGAGEVIDALEPLLPFEFIKLHHAPDGHFPNGVPNPLLPENRPATIEAIRTSGADLAIAWDGDFDRCFLFDETGAFIEGYYIVGLLAEAFLRKAPGSRIVHDPRLTWNTIDIVERLGGSPIQSKTGHAFIKERMRAEDAIYGGEMSAHHYFRDFAYCDSGMIPWLLTAELISRSGKPLSQLVRERMAKFPVSGEINRRVEQPERLIAEIEQRFAAQAVDLDHTDGLSMQFDDWRFNLRMSNTEPVLRLNVESRGDPALMERKTAELLALIGGVA